MVVVVVTRLLVALSVLVGDGGATAMAIADDDWVVNSGSPTALVDGALPSVDGTTDVMRRSTIPASFSLISRCLEQLPMQKTR